MVDQKPGAFMVGKKLKLMAVLAHPDDESLGFGGTLAKYAAEGIEVYLVTATRGEAGRFGLLGKSGDPLEVGRVREAELRAAATVLGIREVSVLGFPDGAVDRVSSAIAIRSIVSHIRRIQPDVIVTFGPEGAYGHPDHIAVSQFATAATVCAADAGFDLDGGSELDLARPHRVSKFYYLAWRSNKATPWPDWAVTTEIDTAEVWPIVWRAVCCHQTQISIYERLGDLTTEQQKALWGSQEFYRVFSAVNGGRELETDLFEGLR